MESVYKVKEWALANGFEESTIKDYCKRLPFGCVYLDFSDKEDITLSIIAIDDDKGRFMFSDRRPLWMISHLKADYGDWLMLWLKCSLYKYVDELLE